MELVSFPHFPLLLQGVIVKLHGLKLQQQVDDTAVHHLGINPNCITFSRLLESWEIDQLMQAGPESKNEVILVGRGKCT